MSLLTKAPLRAGGFGMMLFVSACGLPRSGPDISEIEAQPTGEEAAVTLPFEVVQVTDDVAKFTARNEALAFQIGFRQALEQNVNLIGNGDSISVTVWENVDNGLMTGMGQKFTVLQESQVDQTGYIFVPYVGRIRAAGRSPEEIRQIITAGLEGQTPDPQVEVRRLQMGSSTVNIIGSVGAPGIYPIEASNQRLLSMLSLAGGSSIEPETTVVTLRRGNVSGRIWLQDIFDNPETDVALHGGDSIIVERDRRAFVALGALGTQTRINFPTRNIHALEALGLVGGLDSQLADPTGIFVFREELPQIAHNVIPEKEFTEPVRVAYVIDLTRPGGMFTAKDFVIRDDDVVFVTEAPMVRVIKALGSLTPFINTAGSVNNLAGN